MQIEHLFLFEFIEKGSNVIIYGLGDVGKTYLRQIERTNWCNVIAVSDRKANRGNIGYDFCPLEELSKLSGYDYFIIAIEDLGIASDAYRQLVHCGIDRTKIVNQNMRNTVFPVKNDVRRLCDEYLSVAFKLEGGMGDYIVYESFYETFINICPDCVIDLFGIVFLQNVFNGKKNVRELIAKEKGINFANYDLIISLQHTLAIHKLDKVKVNAIAPDLYEKLLKYENTWGSGVNDISSSNQYRDAVILKRANVLKFDRYRTLGGNGIFHLTPDMVKIDLLPLKEEFVRLNLKKYITLNWGAAKLPGVEEKQTKVWPLEYYNEFILLFKERYPDIEVIQIGAGDAEKIKNTDRYLLGLNMELIKYVLKDSFLHIDCEGGLVHLATALGTKCAVLFGPTPIDYYGYKSNINLTAGKCCNCMGVTENWFSTCFKGQEKPECMYGIMPEYVLDKISPHIDSINV